MSRRVDSSTRLDPEQSAAVRAGDGVVQVIAPAGSGKTTVLVARVKELISRGAPPERILCTTFNKDAVTEMGARLAGVVRVGARLPRPQGGF
jgi:superfamily I DNA/RNA helicase